MLGRDAERAVLDEVLQRCGQNRTGVLLISGEAGIGKTTLLAYARQAADGARLLKAAGVEAESRLAFAGLADLLGPIANHIDDLPAPQADALRGALALGPASPGDRFTTYAATLGLLAAAADDGPVVCIVDDAH